MKEKVFVSAVVYTHNAADIIKSSLSQIDKALADIFEYYEIIVVNDASTDATVTEAKKASECMQGDLCIINLSHKHGIEKAMMAGLIKSMGDFVFEFEDINMSIDEAILRSMFSISMQGNDIVAASPFQSASWKTRLFYKVINKISYLDLDLRTEVIRLVSRRALNAMLNLKEKVRYRKALYAYSGYKKMILTIDSTASRSKKMNRENMGTAFDIIVSFSNLGLKISHYLSVAFFVFSLFMAGYALFNYSFNRSVVEGWTTLMILISFGFAGLFFIVGMLGEYISRILIELQDRPFYSTQSVQLIQKSKNTEKQTAMQEVAVSTESNNEVKI
ncbi:putative glycosyltransferase [Paenibacillus plantiphilus]|uniref:Glycosyltransferase n=1 Tax=Paenibacillus plantiphilus TaxID=2905650 RepID=A0ABM9BS88_9BACL|nr:glycosyltransferase [Paenibacillus plantiphilus]CAH1193324.1 putative glycosyltransferase [Paenibacillus plantiphilus]